MIISSILIIKILVSIFIVLTLSIVAEKVSPKVSGLLSGYPLGSAVALFFYGLEISPEFASESAVYTLIGLIGAQVFVYVYYQISLRTQKYSPLFSSLSAIFAFLFVTTIFNALDLSKISILLLTFLSVILFIFLFRKLADVEIKSEVKLSFKAVFIRALLATLIIVLITSLPELIGKKWAGYFSGFPITLFPLILIIHITYQKEQVHTIIKNFPKGLGALILYSISVYKLYPLYGIYIGTLISFLLATVYLLLIMKLTSKNNL